jgi:ribosome-interacting GTPase 1
MGRTQKNKATSYHLGQLKAKLARLKREMLDGATGKKVNINFKNSRAEDRPKKVSMSVKQEIRG